MKMNEGKVFYRMDIIRENLRTNLLNLPNVVLQALTILHSNTGEGRVFSLINKNKTQFRSALGLGSSINIVRLTIIKCYSLKIY